MKTIFIACLTVATVAALFISYNEIDEQKALSPNLTKTDNPSVDKNTEQAVDPIVKVQETSKDAIQKDEKPVKEKLKKTDIGQKKKPSKKTKEELDRHNFKELLEEDIEFIELS